MLNNYTQHTTLGTLDQNRSNNIKKHFEEYAKNMALSQQKNNNKEVQSTSSLRDQLI